MPNLYKVTFRFARPVRGDSIVEVTGDNEEEVIENAHIEATRKGVIFGFYAYNEVPVKVELVEENV